MDYSLVIFDCDGVLVDSEIVSAEVEAEAFTALGAKITAQEAMSMFLGMTQSAMEDFVRQKYGIEVPVDHKQRTAGALRQAYVERLKPIAGVRELIQKLRVPYCVASNSPPSKLGLGLAVTDLFELVYPNVFSSKLVARGKPAPDLFLYAAEKMGFAPRDAVVIEDSVAGVTAAKAAGMRVIGFLGGLHHGPPGADMLRAAGADHMTWTMEEVGALLGV